MVKGNNLNILNFSDFSVSSKLAKSFDQLQVYLKQIHEKLETWKIN